MTFYIASRSDTGQTELKHEKEGCFDKFEETDLTDVPVRLMVNYLKEEYCGDYEMLFDILAFNCNLDQIRKILREIILRKGLDV